jgi:hypothetical protein
MRRGPVHACGGACVTTSIGTSAAALQALTDLLVAGNTGGITPSCCTACHSCPQGAKQTTVCHSTQDSCVTRPSA